MTPIGRFDDITKQLSMTFGGFSPMALSDAPATREQMENAERIQREYRAMREHSAELERARETGHGKFDDGVGRVYDYAVLDGAFVRIDRCETECALVEFPSQVEGLPVRAIRSDALSHNECVEEIVCPDGIAHIGPYAFRDCARLRRVVFPDSVCDYDFTWTKLCTSLEDLVLPGGLEKIGPAIFDAAPLRRLVIGRAASEVVPGAFGKSKLEEIEIHPDSPYLKTDGEGIYTADGSVLIALARPVERYTVASGCRAIAKKGTSTFSSCKEITVPDTLEVLGEFALSRTGIESFIAPPALRVVDKQAFFRCASLADVQLNEGITYIGADAFSGTAIAELRVPASILEIGPNVADNTALTYAGPNATFSIAPGAKTLWMDEEGCLFANRDDGVHLVRCMDPKATVMDLSRVGGVVAIDPSAFAKHKSIQDVTLPAGVKAIGAGAFKGCRALTHVSVPDSVERIEEEAFIDTALVEFRIPQRLEHLGENALITYDAHHGDAQPSLSHVEVAPGQEIFYTSSGLLLQRRPNNKVRLVLCESGHEVVKVPPEVTSVNAYAFNGQRGMRELWLHDNIYTAEICGLATKSMLDLIHVDLLREPVEGHTSVEIRFPHTARAKQQLNLAMGMIDHVNLQKIYQAYDNTIINAQNFDGLRGGGLGVYEQGMRLIERLRDPLFMLPVSKSMARQFLERRLLDFCVEVAKHDDRRTIDDLLELGLIDGDNLSDIIDRVGAVQDAAMTGYLLELKRTRFGMDSLDFDL